MWIKSREILNYSRAKRKAEQRERGHNVRKDQRFPLGKRDSPLEALLWAKTNEERQAEKFLMVTPSVIKS